MRFPCFAQPKLNGFRAIYKDGNFYSRSGNQWADSLLAHILKRLRKHCDRGITLDGEFYRHGWTLDRIAEAISLFRQKPDHDTLEIGFYVFDFASELPFLERCSRYHAAVDGVCGHVQPVPALNVDDYATADAIHDLNLKAGFEGTIYRTGSQGYRSGRNTTLMKRKPKPGSGFTEERIKLMSERESGQFTRRTDRWHLVR